MEASTLIDPRVVDAVTTVVGVVAHGPLEHGTYEAVVDGKPATRCRLYRNLDCGEHQTTHEALKPYQVSGRFRIPFTVWIDLEGKQMFRKDGWRRPEEFLLDLRTALEKIPGPHPTRPEYEAFVKPLQEAHAAVVAERYVEAAAKFEEARQANSEEIRKRADAGLLDLRTRGDAILKGAKAALKAGKVRNARPALDVVAREFPALECGKEAVELLKGIPFPMRRVSFIDIHPARGGRALYLRGDGSGVAQFVTPAAEGQQGLQERRYDWSMAPRDWDELGKLVDEHRFFEMRFDPSGSPEDGRIDLAIELWTGAAGTFSKAGKQVHPGFDALQAWLVVRLDAAATGRLSRQGTFDPAWRPNGFSIVR